MAGAGKILKKLERDKDISTQLRPFEFLVQYKKEAAETRTTYWAQSCLLSRSKRTPFLSAGGRWSMPFCLRHGWLIETEILNIEGCSLLLFFTTQHICQGTKSEGDKEEVIQGQDEKDEGTNQKAIFFLKCFCISLVLRCLLTYCSFCCSYP